MLLDVSILACYLMPTRQATALAAAKTTQRSIPMRARKILVGSGLALAILGAAGLVTSIPASAQTTPAPAAKTTDDDAAEFAKLDKNKDGFVDKTEAVMEPRLMTNFDAADTNKDGKVDKNEWAAFQKNKSLVIKK